MFMGQNLNFGFISIETTQHCFEFYKFIRKYTFKSKLVQKYLFYHIVRNSSSVQKFINLVPKFNENCLFLMKRVLLHSQIFLTVSYAV